MMPRKLAAVLMRGGTSKALVFKRADLPADPGERDRFFLVAAAPAPKAAS